MSFKVTVESIESGTARLKFPDGQTLNIALTDIHGTPSVGANIHVLFSTGIADQPNTQDLARSLLNELISTETR